MASNLAAYRQNRLEIEAKSLPLNADIKSGYAAVDADRGSANFIDFVLIEVRRFLMSARDD